MEFNEKLQELRKQKGLTQEELSEALYVSRAAISKWEAGRGYPNIDSLKAIAAYFSVTIDDLLSGGETLTLTEENQRKAHIRDLVFGLLDCSTALLLFLPFFGEKAGGMIRAVSLLGLTGTAPYLKAACLAVVLAVVVCGILTLALQNCCQAGWVRSKRSLSILLGSVGMLLFIVGLQPYAAALMFVFLAIKVWMLIKKQ